ncbi:hypothetical protein KCP77_24150 [Salmonella enterica subsp. enterica]|nr:hypothetical protein KCP77_24150 [Salmonella enterica subsp. enterica]
MRFTICGRCQCSFARFMPCKPDKRNVIRRNISGILLCLPVLFARILGALFTSPLRTGG